MKHLSYANHHKQHSVPRYSGSRLGHTPRRFIDADERLSHPGEPIEAPPRPSALMTGARPNTRAFGDVVTHLDAYSTSDLQKCLDVLTTTIQDIEASKKTNHKAKCALKHATGYRASISAELDRRNPRRLQPGTHPKPTPSVISAQHNKPSAQSPSSTADDFSDLLRALNAYRPGFDKTRPTQAELEDLIFDLAGDLFDFAEIKGISEGRLLQELRLAQ